MQFLVNISKFWINFSKFNMYLKKVVKDQHSFDLQLPNFIFFKKNEGR